MIRTYLDSGTLIYAGRGEDTSAEVVLNILDDANREFVSSPFVKLEVLPKAVYFGKLEESDFYREYFASILEMPDDYDVIIAAAQSYAERYGLAGMDALHIAAAVLAGAEEFITTEAVTKPMFRVTELKVTRLQSLMKIEET